MLSRVIAKNVGDVFLRHSVYTTKRNTRFSPGILSCYIQALGSPQCRNLINTNRNNEYSRILNTGF